MKPNRTMIAAFLTNHKQIYKFMVQDCAALQKLGGQELLIESLRLKQRYLFQFIIEFQERREATRKESIQNNVDPGQMNKHLQQMDDEFWESLTEQQFKVVAKYGQQAAAKTYVEEIRLIIPSEVLEQIAPNIEKPPVIPLSKEDYLQMQKKQ